MQNDADDAPQQQQQEEVQAVCPIMLQNPDAYPLMYCRYYTGHTGRAGHEFLEFEIKGDQGGLLQYANNSNYRKSGMIKKAVHLSQPVLNEIKRIVLLSGILDSDDSNWPEPDRNGRQEIEILIGSVHISFVTNKITLVSEAENSQDPQGLLSFIYLINDLKGLVLNLIGMHYRVPAI